MTYSPKVSRQAKRLGIVLPDDDYVIEEGWSSDGADTLFEGPCKLDRRNDGGWAVSLRRSGKKGGYRRVAEVVDLDAALEMAHFLSKAQNRRAFRGLAPKERKAEVKADGWQAAMTTYDDLTAEDAKAALRAELLKANGGAVTVN